MCVCVCIYIVYIYDGVFSLNLWPFVQNLQSFCIMAALLPFPLLLSLLSGIERDPVGKFFSYSFRMFFVRYAEGSYLEALAWGRLMAETYCHFALGGPAKQSWVGLYELIEELRRSKPGFFESEPEPGRSELATSSAYVLALEAGPLISKLAQDFGAGFSGYAVAEDLQYLRVYGNYGVHAWRFLLGERAGPDADMVASILRVAISFVSIYSLFRGHVAMTFPLSVRSRL